jgi:hypothetical protein
VVDVPTAAVPLTIGVVEDSPVIELKLVPVTAPTVVILEEPDHVDSAVFSTFASPTSVFVRVTSPVLVLTDITPAVKPASVPGAHWVPFHLIICPVVAPLWVKSVKEC